MVRRPQLAEAVLLMRAVAVEGNAQMQVRRIRPEAAAQVVAVQVAKLGQALLEQQIPEEEVVVALLAVPQTVVQAAAASSSSKLRGN